MIEAVPEDQALKEDVLGRCSAAAPATAIIASNTSSLPIEGLAARGQRAGALPRRALVQPAGVDARDRGHRRLRRRAARPSSASSSSCAAIGKRPAEVADRAGFVSNRLQMALLREALAIVDEGLATRESLDEVVRSTFGFRLPFFGPFLIADMAGLDTYASVFETLERDVGPEFAVPGALRELVDAGPLGTKSGEGFGDVHRRGARRAAARRATAATRRSRSCSPRPVDVCDSPRRGPICEDRDCTHLGRSGS